MKHATPTLLAPLLLSLLAPMGTSAAGPQLFKCVEGGRTIYQQQACSVTSQSEAAASSAQSIKTSPDPAAKVARIKPASLPTSLPASSALATPR